MRIGNCIVLLLFTTTILVGQNTEIQGGLIVDSINNNSGIISNVASPSAETDAATKKYADDAFLDIAIELGTRVQDVDGNVYKTIKIGKQRWLAENLRVTKYNDGTPLPNVTDNAEWGNLDSPAYAWYLNNQAANEIPYGALYNYFAVADTNSLNICPVGWHVPSLTDWNILTNYLGDLDLAGGKLKETGNLHWASQNGATNETDFTAVGSGFRQGTGFSAGVYFNRLVFGVFWSSTEAITIDRSVVAYVTRYDAKFAYTNYVRKFGLAVRCVSN